MSTVTMRPTSDQAKSGETYSSGTTAWNLVDEAVLDSADWVDNKTVSGYTIFGFGSSGIPAGSVINSVQINWRGSNAAPANACSTQFRNPSSGTRYDQDNIAQSASSVTGANRTTRPWDSAKWTISDIDAIQAGVRAPTSGSLNKLRTTQFWIVVDYTAPTTVSSSFTADAVLFKTVAPSFTIDASIFDGTYYFNVKAVIYGTRTGSFTADAIKRRNIPQTFTADAAISVTHSGSFTADATILFTQGAAETDDPFTSAVSGGWGPDFTVEDTDPNNAATMSVDPTEGALFYEPEAVTAYQWRKFRVKKPKRLNRNSAFVVSIKQTAGSINVSYLTATIHHRHDDKLGIGLDYYQSQYLALDLRLYAPNGFGDFTINQGAMKLGVRTNYDATDSNYIGPGLVDVPGLTWAPRTVDTTSRFYVRFHTRGTSPTRVKAKIWRYGDPEPNDWLLDFTTTSGPTTTGWLVKGTGSRVAMYPTWAFKRITSFYLDQSFETDAVLLKPVTVSTTTANAVLKKTQTGTRTLDAVIKRLGQPGSFSVGAAVSLLIPGSFSADSILGVGRSSSFSIDSHIRVPGLEDFTIDAWLAEGGFSFTADAIVKKQASDSLLASSVLKRSSSASFSADAIKSAEQNFAFALDAQISVLRTDSAVLDAVLRRTGLVSFTADAILHREQQSSATVSSIVRKGATGSFDTSALLLSPRTGSFTANAVIFRTTDQTFDLTAVLKGEVNGAFTADSIRRVPRASSFTADAIRQTVPTGSVPADAIVFKTWELSFGLDAVCGLAVLAPVAETTVVPNIEFESDVALAMLGFTSTLQMIEAVVGIEYLETQVEIETVEGAVTYD